MLIVSHLLAFSILQAPAGAGSGVFVAEIPIFNTVFPKWDAASTGAYRSGSWHNAKSSASQDTR